MSTEENFEGFENSQVIGLNDKNKPIYEALMLADPANITTAWVKILSK